MGLFSSKPGGSFVGNLFRGVTGVVAPGLSKLYPRPQSSQKNPGFSPSVDQNSPPLNFVPVPVIAPPAPAPASAGVSITGKDFYIVILIIAAFVFLKSKFKF